MSPTSILWLIFYPVSHKCIMSWTINGTLEIQLSMESESNLEPRFILADCFTFDKSLCVVYHIQVFLVYWWCTIVMSFLVISCVFWNVYKITTSMTSSLWYGWSVYKIATSMTCSLWCFWSVYKIITTMNSFLWWFLEC